MTREDAIEEIRYYCQDSEKIIKALDQEPCEDAISRSELKKWLDINFSFGGALRKLELFNRLDNELAPVIPKGVTVTDFADKCKECGKQRKGKWIEIKNKNGTVIALRCNCCEKSPKYAIRSLWCPNCGAKMGVE